MAMQSVRDDFQFRLISRGHVGVLSRGTPSTRPNACVIEFSDSEEGPGDDEGSGVPPSLPPVAVPPEVAPPAGAAGPSRFYGSTLAVARATSSGLSVTQRLMPSTLRADRLEAGRPMRVHWRCVLVSGPVSLIRAPVL